MGTQSVAVGVFSTTMRFVQKILNAKTPITVSSIVNDRRTFTPKHILLVKMHVYLLPLPGAKTFVDNRMFFRQPQANSILIEIDFLKRILKH